NHARQTSLRDQHALVFGGLAHFREQTLQFVFCRHSLTHRDWHSFGERVFPQPLLRSSQIGWLLQVYLDRSKSRPRCRRRQPHPEIVIHSEFGSQSPPHFHPPCVG